MQDEVYLISRNEVYAFQEKCAASLKKIELNDVKCSRLLLLAINLFLF